MDLVSYTDECRNHFDKMSHCTSKFLLYCIYSLNHELFKLSTIYYPSFMVYWMCFKFKFVFVKFPISKNKQTSQQSLPLSFCCRCCCFGVYVFFFVRNFVCRCSVFRFSFSPETKNALKIISRLEKLNLERLFSRLGKGKVVLSLTGRDRSITSVSAKLHLL